MKSKVLKSVSSNTYPCLKEGPYGTIVLFIGNNTGTAVFVANKSRVKLGEYLDDWTEDVFKPFIGVVELSN